MSLLGFVFAQSRLSKKQGIFLIVVELLSQALWLNFAYQLEFLGQNTFFIIWIAGIVFFLTHILVMTQIMRYHQPRLFEQISHHEKQK